MSIKPLNHYSITNPASVYDEESMTVLELAGRTAAKVNETVDAFNKLETDTGERLMDMKSKQIPETVKKEFDDNVKDGTFDGMIDKYVGNLEQRIDNLTGSITPGSTTADAELIDIRAGGDGQNYKSAGEASRANYGIARKAIDLIKTAATNKAFTMKGTPVENQYNLATIISSVMVDAGSDSYIQSVDAVNYRYKTASIPVDELSFYYVKAIANHGNGLIVAETASGKPLDYIHSESVPELTTFEGYFFTPKNTKYLTISYYENSEKTIYKGHCYKIDTICVNDDLALIPDITSEFNRLFDSGTGNVFDVTGDNIPLVGVLGDTIIDTVGNLKTITTTIEGYKIASAYVTPGKLYHVKANANYGNACYCFYDADGKPIFVGDISEDVNTYHHVNGIISAPANAVKIIIAYNSNEGEGRVEENIKLSPLPVINGGRDWRGKKWVCMGDSLTERNSRASKFYHDYIAEETGVTVVNLGVSGSGYRAGIATNKHFVNIAASVPTDADVVTIFGSFNDLGAISGSYGDVTDFSTNTLAGCINLTIEKIYAKNPLARVGIIAPTPWETIRPDAQPDHQYIMTLKAVAKRWGIPVLDLYHESGLRPDSAPYRNLVYSKDDGNGVHPNEIGHKMIASQIREFIAGLI